MSFRLRIKNIIKKLQFNFYIFKIKFRNRIDFSFVLRNSLTKFVVVSLLYFLILALSIFLIGRFIDPAIDKSNAMTFFTAAATMIGGILAIIFTLSIFLIGNAAERVPVGFYETAAKDRIFDLIFFLISIFALTIFIFALVFEKFINSKFIIILFQISLFIIGIVFYLIFLFYLKVRIRINPSNVQKIASNQAMLRLDSIYKRAKEFSEVLIKYPGQNKAIEKEQAVALSFQYLKPEFVYVNDRLNYLFDYHNKLIASNERSSALEVLQILVRILKKYFQIRSESSIVLHVGSILTTTSDSREFLTPPLEKLLGVGEKYMRDNDNEGITKTISVFLDLCKSASEIKYLTNVKSESPIFSQCRGYLDQLLKSAIKLNYQEALFQGAIVYPKIMKITIKRNYLYEFEPTYKILEAIATNAVLNKFSVVFIEVINSYSEITTQLVILKYYNFKIEISRLLKYLSNLVRYSFIDSSLENDFSVQISLQSSFKNISNLIFKKAEDFLEAKNKEDERESKRVFFSLVEELRVTLRDLSEKIKKIDYILLTTFGNIISEVGELLLDLSIKEKWAEDRGELIKQVSWYLHQLEWFTYEVNDIKENTSFNSLVEAAARIGIRALERDHDEIAKEAIKIISDFSNKMLNSKVGSTYGFAEPRIMEKACFIGILALKLNKSEIVTQLKKNITIFEEAYIKKYFSSLPEGASTTSPSKKQLMLEIDNLKNEIRDRVEIYRVMETASVIITKLITVEDVNKFIFEIWEVTIETGDIKD